MPSSINNFQTLLDQQVGRLPQRSWPVSSGMQYLLAIIPARSRYAVQLSGKTERSIKEAEKYTDQLVALPGSCLGYCGWWYVCDTARSLQDLSEFPWIQIHLTVSPFLTTHYCNMLVILPKCFFFIPKRAFDLTQALV